MNPIDKKAIVERYVSRAKEFGHGLKVIGEPKDRQFFYYDFMLRADGFTSADSILDVGCCYGDLYDYLQRIGWTGRYLGVDINASLIEAGRAKFPGLDLRVLDLQESPPQETFDWAFSCHVLTNNMQGVDYLVQLEEMLIAMWRCSRKGLLFNLLSPLADFTNPIHARPAFGKVLDIVARLSNRFTLRHDYMPYEFALYVYKNNEVNRDLLIFSEHDATFGSLAALGRREG